MPTFEVQSAFQCIRCRKVNINTVVVAATDEYVARELALASTICGRCSRHLSDKQSLTMKVKEAS
jgi:hypothetical protein